jgi:hypothetical protein
VDLPQVEIVDKVVEVPVQKQVQVPMITKMQRAVDVPQIQFVDKVIEVPTQKQVQVPMITTVQKVVEVPQIEIVDKHVHIPVQKQRHVPVVQRVPKHVEVTVIETVEKIVDVPVVKQVEVPQIQTIEKIVEVPYIQTVEKIVEIPTIGDTLEGVQKHMTIQLETVRQEEAPVVEEQIVMGAPLPPEVQRSSETVIEAAQPIMMEPVAGQLPTTYGVPASVGQPTYVVAGQ